MTAQLGGTPILILPEKTQRIVGKDAQRANILAARIIGEALRTTLGPKGMDKMLVDNLGDIVVTNDGVTILKEMEVEHPAAKMLVEIAKAQDAEAGDGTTTVVVLAGELLKKAEELLDQDIHPTVIANGYRMAADKAMELLEKIARPVSIDDRDTLKKVALTSMTGKASEAAKDFLGDLVVKAVTSIVEKQNGKVTIDIDNIKIEKKEGESIENTELVKGIVIDKEVVHPGMPKRVENARIALINAPLEIEKTEFDAEIRITDPSQIKAFLDEEEKILREMVEKIVQVGANVVFCQKGIDDIAQHYLAKHKILAVRRVKKSDMEKLAKATGGRIVTNLQDLTPDDLGYAGLVEEVKVGKDNMVFVRDCKDPKSVTILVRGGSEHIVSEIERNINDAIHAVTNAIKDGKVLPGGGAAEIDLALKLRDYAKTVGGREQLAIESFAEALESVPAALAENAGLDPIDILVELRAAHEQGKTSYGIDVYEGKVKDMYELGVIEPLKVKKHAIAAAAEAAIAILRIDDVIAAQKLEKEKKEEKKEEKPE